jgi:bifunctional UDP-N-acetylglucosamine pyrophosphorylase / glucosamine-1-phosphate N-acetyltransferase
MAEHLAKGAAVTIVTCHRTETRGLGRVVRKDGRINGIVEDRDAQPEEASISETNEGVYCLDAVWAWAQLSHLPKAPNGEYYLTSLIGIAAAQGRPIASVQSERDETMGVNDRVELARAESAMRTRIRERIMLSGVTIMDPPSTFIDAGVEVGQDSVIHPNTTLAGNTVVGADCQIGPHSIVRDSNVGDGCTVLATVLEESVLESHVEVGPYSHLRPGSHVEQGVHLGNYVEIKNSRIGSGSAIGHFSYIGDATVGRRVNIGAGTITANYDGTNKNETHIGDDVFIGCDSILVAPVNIADRAATGAGSVVTKDVPEDTLVVGVPARPVPGKHGPR